MCAKPICEVTHPLIAEGNCPWCGALFSSGQPVPEDDVSKPETLEWNAAALAVALADESAEVRSTTLANFMGPHRPAPDVAIPLLAKAMADDADEVSMLAEQALAALGRDLPQAEAKQYEDRLANSPHPLATRVLLLGNYLRGQQTSPSIRAARHRHVLWLIEHAPESKTAGSPYVLLLYPEDAGCYAQAKALWLDLVQADPADIRLLGNAAAFFEFKDPQLSEDFLTSARKLEPSNPHWRERLGQHFALQSIRDPSAQLKNAAHALQELKAADEVRLGAPWQADAEKSAEKSERDIVLNTLSRIHTLPRLAKAAFDAGQADEARRYATDALEAANSDKLPEAYRDNGDAIHQANLILGRCALAKGDVEQAKHYLIASGKTKGSPVLASVGPSMTLAKELLERGESDVVLEYFKLCSSFWQHPDSPLEQWANDVKQGRIPEFIPFLLY